MSKLKIFDMAVPNSPLYQLSQVVGRELDLNFPLEKRSATLLDTEVVYVPDFIEKRLARPFITDSNDVLKDLFHQRILSDSNYREKLTNAWLKSFKALSSMNYCKNDILNKSYQSMSIKELKKAQILVGSPLFHTPLSGGSHFNHADIPSSFTMLDWSWVSKLGMALAEHKNFVVAANHSKDVSLSEAKFTLPLLTSQGLALAGALDSPNWRAFAKALSCAIVAKIDGNEAFNAVLDELDSVWVDNGYEPLMRTFFLGLRRQHVGRDKPELVQYAEGSSANAIAYASATNGVQGRARGIFPPNEISKAYYKPIAEIPKSILFHNTACCSVDLDTISAQQVAVTLLTLDHDLIDSEGGWLCFSDMSEFDKTQHAGLYDNYLSVLHSINPDWKRKYGDMFMNYSLIFPQNPGRGSILRQDIMGRSTLSGQPDVTTKNNIIHLMCMVRAISLIKGVEVVDVIRDVLKGSGDYIVHIHGDDGFMYIGSDARDYDKYKAYIEQMGLKLSYEAGPVFLKKLPNAELITSLLPKKKGLLSVQEALKLGHTYVSKYKSKWRQESKTSALTLEPVLGSLQRNRFGEYPLTNFILAQAALVDTAHLASVTAPQEFIELWETIAEGTFGATSWSTLLSKEFDEATSKAVMEFAKGSESQARAVRHFLERSLYSGNENMLDEDMIRIYGELEYEPSELIVEQGLTTYNLRQLINMYKMAQLYIIENAGKTPDINFLLGQASKLGSSKIS